MKTLHFEIDINAPVAHVWETLLEDSTYRKWTSAFMEGIYFKGSWEKGERMQFLGPDGGGLSSIIEENKPNEFLSIKHIGIMNNFVEDTTSEEAKKWTPSYENYTLSQEDGKTTLTVDMQVEEGQVEEFNVMWPKALKLLKELAERTEGEETITASVEVKTSVKTAWEMFTDPKHIMQWNFASDDWECPGGENDVRSGGRFCITMASKDGKSKFDFTGVYTLVVPQERLEYFLDDGRKVVTTFQKVSDDVTKVTTTFEMEHENSKELQHSGWQAILGNYKKYVESLSS